MTIESVYYYMLLVVTFVTWCMHYLIMWLLASYDVNQLAANLIHAVRKHTLMDDWLGLILLHYKAYCTWIMQLRTMHANTLVYLEGVGQLQT